jgi:hypothetical protein
MVSGSRTCERFMSCQLKRSSGLAAVYQYQVASLRPDLCPSAMALAHSEAVIRVELEHSNCALCCRHAARAYR